MLKVTISVTDQRATLMIQLFNIFLFFQCATGLRGGALANSISNQNIEVPEMDSLSAYQLGDLVIESMTLSRRNVRSDLNREIIVSDVDENGKFVGTYSSDCSKVILMPPPRVGKVKLNAAILEKGHTECHWKLIGTRNCLPKVTCFHFNLFGADPNITVKDPCPVDYLEVTDGSFGYQKFCGTNGPVNITTRRNARELYLTLKLGYHAKNRLFLCYVRCMTSDKDKKNIKPLADNIAPLTNQHCKCGRKRYTDFKQNSTKPEDEVHKSEIPWIAALVVAGTRNPLCVGTVINDRFVLTAAHCFRGSFVNVSSVEILIHPHQLNASRVIRHVLGKDAHVFPPEELKEMDDNDRSFRYPISRYFLHPLQNKQTNDFDLALVKLARPLDFSEKKVAVPICLPDTGSWDLSNEGESVFVSAWNIRPMFYNRTDDINIIKTLRKRQVEVFHRADCNNIYGWRFSDRFLCAGQRTNISSLGDIGSPLMSEKSKGVWEQIGLLTYGQGVISRKGPGIYISLRQVVQWIKHMSNLEKAVWCADTSAL